MKKLTVLILLLSLYPLQSQSQIGTWLFSLNSKDIGYAQFYMTFATEKDESFTAHSDKGGSRRALGAATSTLGRLFTKNFKKGALVWLVKGKTTTDNGTIKLKAIFTSAFANYYFKGYLVNNTLVAELTNKKGEIKGRITAIKNEKKTPVNNYPELLESALKIANQKIFSPDITGTKKWKKFNRKITKVAKKAHDDLEMITAFFYRANKLDVSHFSFIREIPQEKPTENFTPSRYITLEEKTSQTVYMKIASFSGSANEVDSVFNIIKRKGYKNLIVDLRNNSGGTVEAGMQFARHLTSKEYYGGIFLTRKWFDNNSKPPLVQNYSQYPHFTASNFDLIIKGVHEKEALCLKVQPVSSPFTGKVYILANKRTASTCEPIVYGLKQYGLATIVGQTTAGAMLNGEFFEVGNGYNIIVPTADYYTADRYRIDQKGVTPNIVTEKGEALKHVLKLIN